METHDRENEIAVVGMSARLPGARDTAEYWRNLCDGVESIARFSHADLIASGVTPEILRDPSFVPAHGAIDDAYAFDAGFFGMSAREAQVMDPQQRVFLECAWSALEDAGYDPRRFPGTIGVFAGSGSSAHLARVLKHPELVATVGANVVEFANAKDFLTTRVSYKLGLRGPSLAIQTACSTSLVAIHVACQSLLGRECDLALAGGVTIATDQTRGYRYQEGGILSPDGHCRAFDARAAGTVAGSGAGIVLLKRLPDALRDGDVIHAVVKGSAINNDGAGKVGFTAPSVAGQARAIAEALCVGGVEASTVSYIETHGTGTALGDPIEIAALTEVFRASSDARRFCALGAVKTNIGHLDCAAGVAGFIKTVLALKHHTLPPTLHFETPNPETAIADSPFYVNAALTDWIRNGHPRRAGVSSFGIGGTNAHVVLEEAPEIQPSPSDASRADRAHLVILSARTDDALERTRQNLSRHLTAHAGLSLADVALTLQDGRAAHPHRWTVAARDLASVRRALTRDAAATRVSAAGRADDRPPAVAFLFPGQGTQYAGMAWELYTHEPMFRRTLDQCFDALVPHVGLDLRSLLFAEENIGLAQERLRQTRFTQPALFAVEYALATLWMSWGVRPDAMLGHSIGEYVAACLAGVFPLDHALRLVATRGRLMQKLPGGAMLAVPLSEADMRERIAARPRLSLAAVNASSHTVVAGPDEEIRELEAELGGRDVPARRLHTSHAFHSAAMDPMLAAFRAEVRRAQPSAPALRFVSNVTGDWITDDQATDADYWTRHLRETVRFADGVGRLLDDPRRVLLEVGPGETLGLFARRHPSSDRSRVIARSLPAANQTGASDLAMLEAAGALWTAGVEMDWKALRGESPARRVQLPTYPFERTEYRVPRPSAASSPSISSDTRAVATPVAPTPVTPTPVTPTPVTPFEATPSPDGAPASPLLRTVARVTALFAGLLGADAAQLDPASSFLALGADSLLLMQVSRTIETTFGVRVPFRQLLDGLSTIDRLSSHLLRESPPEEIAAEEIAAPEIAAAALHQPDATSPPEVPAAAMTPATTPVAAHGPYRPVRETLGDGGGFDDRQARYFDAFARRYEARTRRSKAYAAEHRPALADNRASLNFRQATKELMYPLVGERSQGSRLWDLDGNEYVDFTLGFGVHFFGHRPSFILRAVEEQLQRGLHLGPQSDLAGPTARLFRELTGMERVTFCNTGSEAVMTALRIARTATGRRNVVIFEGSYHGCFDGVLARRAGTKDDSSIGRVRPASPGTPPGMIDDIVLLPYGTVEALEWLRGHAAELAAVLVEPVQNHNPEFQPREFLREVRSLTARAGAALIFDEMITGFRLHPRGAQGWYGIEADLATYGKVIGGGFPLGIVAGRAALMDAIDGGSWSFGDDSYPMANQTFFAGTFCKHPVTMAAAHAVLRHLREEGPALQDGLNARTARLVSALRDVITEARAGVRILHCGSVFRLAFDPGSRFGDLVLYHLIERGIYVWEGRACFVSTAHTDEDCDRFVHAFRESLAAMRTGGFLPEVAAVTVSRSTVERSFPLTPAQRQIWIHAQLDDDASRAYHEQMVFGLRGQVDVGAMRAALDDVMRHHEALRTVFDPSGDTQTVLPSLAAVVRVEPELAPCDPYVLDTALRAAAWEPFDPCVGPLVRMHVHACGAERHIVQVVFHHLAMDALGSAVFMRDLKAAYRARRDGDTPALPNAMQFSEYASLIAATLDRDRDRQAAWLSRFEHAVPLELFTDRRRSRFPTGRAALETLRIGPALAASLKAFGRREGCTIFTTLLGGLLATLHRLSGQSDFVVGIPSAGRVFPGAESLVGHCVDVLPIRSRMQSSTELLPFLRDVRGLLLDAYEHELFSLARLGDTLPRASDAAPLVSVSFNLEPGRPSRNDAGARFAGLAMESVATRSLFTKFEIAIDAVDHDDEIVWHWVFNEDLFDRATIERMLRGTERTLEQIAGRAAIRVSELDLLDDPVRAQLAAWSEPSPAGTAGIGAEIDASLLAHVRVARCARETPDAIALVHAGGVMTYRELDERAEQLARHLRARGIGPEAPVGVCLDRTPDLIAAVLGIWKAGGVFVPLEPSYPAQRLAAIAAAATIALIVTADGAAGVLSAIDAAFVRFDDLSSEPPIEHDAAAAAAVSARSLAYIIYTSGSTGRPKGVLVQHGSLANLLAATREAFGVRHDDVMPALASCAFDIWLFETFLPLTSGAAVRLVERDRVLEAPALLEEIDDATLLHAVPALMKQIVDAAGEALHRPRRLRHAFVGGDRVPSDLLVRMRAAFPGARTHLLYGPTEAAILASAHAVAAEGVVAGSTLGRPLRGVHVHVCNAMGLPQPPGVPGELMIGGLGVARGYGGEPRLTAERFVPDPFGERGTRLYRTGDRARWRTDGTLEFLGRLDAQVKIRGFRIEPGEIEAALRAQPGVDDAAVIVREESGDPQLVAYLVGGVELDERGAPLHDRLRERLRERLAVYMLPAAFITLDRLPLTPNGKLDVAALPAPVFGASGDMAGSSAPRTPVEEVVTGIWMDVLRVDRIGRLDDFFALGGHSLLAMRAVARVRDALAVAMPLRTLFEHPTVAAFAERIDALRQAGAGATLLPAVTPVVHDGAAPLSFAQERLWFLERLEPGTTAYNMLAPRTLTGALDIAALERALGEIVRRHDVLRTTFADVDGAPVQRIAPWTGLSLPVIDLSPRIAHADRAAAMRPLIRQAIQEELGRPFDLIAGPLLRPALLRLADDEHVLLLGMHHIVSDGWSMGVMFRELSAIYAAYRAGAPSPLPELGVQYADYALWQRVHLRGDALEAQLAYWRAQLANAPALLDLPADHPRPAAQNSAGAYEEVMLPAELLSRLRAMGRRQGVTLYMVLLAAFQVLLAKYADTMDVIVGSPVAGRTRPELEELIGFFVNTLVLRTDLSGDPDVREVLRRVREVALGAYEHQDVPFEQLVSELQPERSLSHSPLFQVLFSLEERDDTPAGLAGLQVRHVGLDVETAKFDLSLGLAASPRGLAAGLSYRTDLFERDTIVRMLRHFAGVLDQMVANVDARLSALTLLDATERAQVVDEWNKTDDEACLIDRCIHQLFEAQAAQTPTAIAAVCGGAALTYGELNARADRLAHHLRRLGVGPDVPVAIYLERRLELVSALLGVLKAGGAYVPLDPSYPAERLAFMLTDANVRVLLTQDSLRAVAPLRPGVPVVSIDEVLAAAVPDTLADRPIGSGANPRSLAYVIYTSGSTGVPKGVAIEHRSVVRLVRSANYVSLGPETVMLQAAPVSFDASTLELWGPLLNGGRLVLIEESTPSLEAIGAALVTGGVNTMWLTAGLFHVMAEERLEDLRGVRQLLAGGDVLPVEAVRRVQRRFPDLRVINGYGPTENTTFTCCYTVPAPGVQGDAAAPIPIGSPIANTRVYVLDAAGEPVPVGIPGELYAGGAGVARGYLERPGLTAERFVPDPFSPVPGGRAYRTGDRARWRPDGTLSYLGRRDGQVKIRGFRIELGEVETALRQQPGVADAVAVVREDTRGERQLVAYIVGGRDVDAIRTHLGGRLPEHMVPAAFVPLDRLPLTPNGKLNRQALPAPVFESHRHAEHATPSSSPIEEVVAGIWAEVLRLDRFGVTDNFFALGGHSLLAMRVVSRLRDTLGVEIPLRTLFEHPTVRGLSRQLQSIREGTQAIRLPALAPVAHAGAIPPSFAQERLWFLDRLEPGAATYNVVVPRRLIGALDLSALERALPEIFRRHDVLRTRFVSVDGAPTQVIASGCGFALSHVDLSTLDARDRDTEVHRIIRAETVQPFDLATGPLFRATLIHLDAADHVLLLEMHHIVCDGWSLAVLFRELDALYDAYRAGRESPLADLPVQYADYAVWQRAHLRGEVLEAQLAHWRAQLSNLPALLALPTDHPRPATQTYDGAYEQVELPAELLSGLRALGRREGATLYMVLLAAFQVLLGKYAGTEDVVVGAPIAGRTRRELEGLIGFFVNSLVLRTDLSGDPDVRAILRRVREVTLDAYEHQDVPFEQLVGELQPERSLSHTPLFQVVFTLQEDDDALKPAGMSGLEVREIGLDVRTVKFDLQLSVTANGRGLVTGLSYRTDLFERDTIARMLRHLARVLEQMAGDPGLRLSDVQLLGPAERDQVLDAWNAPPEEAPDGAWCLHERFEAQAARTPEAVALIHGEETLSYGELNARANQLARRLIGLGVGPDVRVALCLERSPRLIVSLLAVLKAGGAYVPLDPRYPAERLALMLADSGAAVLVTDEIGSAAVTVPDGITDVCVDRDAAELAGEHAGNPPPAAMPGHLAYVIYTSGSTGVPKGVLIEHRQVARLFTATGAWFDFGPHDVWTLFHSYAFDFSVWEIWGALLYGGRLVIVPHEVSRDLATFHALVLHAGVTVLNQTPSAFRQFIGADGESGGELALRLVIFGGEALEPASLREWVARHGIDRPRLVNMYGITETTVHVTYAPLSLDDVEESARSPIGSRIPDLQLYVLDRAGQPVPIGVPGELYVGGGGVTRGYLNRPALTAQRFVPNPFGAGRLYRTGDLVRRASDGTLNYLGRLDAQVKIRGFRIELGEIEARLCQHEDVDECVVMVREDVIGDKRLVAYVVGEADAPALRAHLRRTLPDYMVPAAFVPLDRLPLTSNGKLHREALPAPDYGEPSREIHAPTNFLEVQLIQIWEELLEVEVNDPTLNFFELGGHSLLAMKLVAQIRRRLHYELPVTTLFAGATVRQMAKAILEQQQLAGTAPSAIVPMQPQGALPPLFCVHPGDRRVLIYTSVVRHFGTNQPMLGLQDLGEDLSRPIPRIAAEYVDAIRSVRPEGPYDLLGWSFGGFVAYEIASQLERQGETVSFLGLMDTIHPDMTRGWITDDLDMLIGIARDVATRARRSFSIDRRELEPLDWEEQFNRVLDALHAQGVPASFDAAGYRDYYDTLQKRLVSTYRYVPGPCSVPITLFRASTSDIDRDPFFAMKTEIERWTLGWSRISSNVNVHPVPGAHSTIGAEPHVRVLVPLMRDLMARARADVIHRPCAVQLASMTESLCP